MEEMIEVLCKNNNTRTKYKFGTNLIEIVKDQNISLKYPILGAKVNNELKELYYRIYSPKTIEFVDITNVDGMRMYIRSLSFILQKAVYDLFPKTNLKIEHSVSKGLFCEIQGLELTSQIISDIKNRMKEIVNEDIAFKRKKILTTDAIKSFEKNRFFSKSKLFKIKSDLYSPVHFLGKQINCFYGNFVPSTGYIKVFGLAKYYNGMLLRIPRTDNPEILDDIVMQDKMFEIFQEHKHWAKILGIETIGDLNEVILNDKIGNIIKISEALHEKKLAHIADKIYDKKDKIKLILISGPSSSGKTTFSKRLAIQLQVAGLKPVIISLDDYFVNRKDTPKDENGEYNFETIDTIDVKLFNQNITDLLDGKEINLPKFSFEQGRRLYTKNKLKINDTGIIIVEGIHALNPNLTKAINPKFKFKIYISALTQISIDSHNRISTTDNRLIRRIVRDYSYRNYSVVETLNRWESVKKGENKNIFPFQEQADIMFNSALLYEFGVLKKYAEPLLRKIPENRPEYSEATRLIKFLSYFLPISDKEIPPTSILREFLEGSSFIY